MAKVNAPVLHQDAVIIPHQYLHAAGGVVTLRDTTAGVILESKRGKKLLRRRPRWKRLSDRDPFLSLIGTLDDEVADVSRNKYKYLADVYSR
jgi:hypothetical protein